MAVDVRFVDKQLDEKVPDVSDIIFHEDRQGDYLYVAHKMLKGDYEVVNLSNMKKRRG